GQLCQAKVQYLRWPSLDKENIRGLDVAVDDALFEGSFQAVGNLYPNVQEFGYRYRLSGNAVLQRLAFQQLHGDKGTAFEFPNIVNCADIRMIERGCSARFAAESLDGLRILGNVVGEEFKSHTAAEARVFGFIDHAHATTAKFFQDAVVRDGAAKNRGSIRHRQRSLPQRLQASKCVPCYRESEHGSQKMGSSGGSCGKALARSMTHWGKTGVFSGGRPRVMAQCSSQVAP